MMSIFPHLLEHCSYTVGTIVSKLIVVNHERASISIPLDSSDRRLLVK